MSDATSSEIARVQVLEEGRGLSSEQALRCLELPDDRLPELLALAHEVRMRVVRPGGRGRGHRLAQDRRLPGGLPLLLPVRAVHLAGPRRSGSTSRRSSRRPTRPRRPGATEFCIVAAVRGPDERLMDQMREGVKAIHEAVDINVAARSACSPRSRSTSWPRWACTATTTTWRPPAPTSRTWSPPTRGRSAGRPCAMVRDGRHGGLLRRHRRHGRDPRAAGRVRRPARRARPDEVPLNFLNPRPGTPFGDLPAVEGPRRAAHDRRLPAGAAAHDPAVRRRARDHPRRPRHPRRPARRRQRRHRRQLPDDPGPHRPSDDLALLDELKMPVKALNADALTQSRRVEVARHVRRRTDAGTDRVRPTWSRRSIAGDVAVAVLRAAYGVDTMFTLSGGHVFPLYDGAVKADPPMRHRRRPARADRGVRRRGDRAADPHARAGGAHRRPRGHQRHQRDHHAPTSTARPWWCWAAGRRTTAGAPGACRRSTTRRCSPRSPSCACTERRADQVGAGVDEAFRTGARRRTGARCSSTSAWTSCSAPRPEAERRARVAPSPPGARPRRRWPRSPGCSPRPSARCSCSAPTSGWTGAEERRPGGAEELPPARDRQRPGRAASCRPGTSCWSPGRGRWRSRQADLVDRGGHAAGLPARATASSAARTAPRPPRSCTWPTPPAQLATHVARPPPPPAT